MKQFDLTVKRKHIKNGRCNEPNGCALAQALIEQFPGAREVAVHYAHAQVLDMEGRNFYFSLPNRAQKFIMDFDDKEPVKPTTFRLRAR